MTSEEQAIRFGQDHAKVETRLREAAELLIERRVQAGMEDQAQARSTHRLRKPADIPGWSVPGIQQAELTLQ